MHPVLTGSIAVSLMAGAAASAAAYPPVSRPVAGIVSPVWGDQAARDRAQEVPQITRRLDLRAGMTVADIGAGSGYDTLRLAHVVGPQGAVLAEDVTPAYSNALKASVAKAGLRNVRVILGAPGDAHLPPRSIDAAIMVHMYHEIAQPYALLARLAPSFRPGGKLGIEELDQPTQVHGTPPKLLVCELKAAGYRNVSLAPLEGGLGYFAVFEPPSYGVSPNEAKTAACRE